MALRCSAEGRPGLDPGARKGVGAGAWAAVLRAGVSWRVTAVAARAGFFGARCPPSPPRGRWTCRREPVWRGKCERRGVHRFSGQGGGVRAAAGARCMRAGGREGECVRQRLAREASPGAFVARLEAVPLLQNFRRGVYRRLQKPQVRRCAGAAPWAVKAGFRSPDRRCLPARSAPASASVDRTRNPWIASDTFAQHMVFRRRSIQFRLPSLTRFPPAPAYP